MKIRYLPEYYYPEQAASSYLGDNIREALCKDGNYIELYTPTPCRGVNNEERKKYCSKQFRTVLMNDGRLRVHRFSLYAEGKNPVLCIKGITI